MGAFDNSASLTDSSMTYDCITEIWFEDRNRLEELFRLLRDPDIAKTAAADEEKFLKRDSMRVVVVEEYRYEKHRKERSHDGALCLGVEPSVGTPLVSQGAFNLPALAGWNRSTSWCSPSSRPF
jgi:hypothetical protein